MKTKYPEYINGVKQIQNPLHRLAVRVWYSDWFRMYFVIVPLWMIPLALLLVMAGVGADACRTICLVLYFALLSAALVFNDYSNLNRIGLDIYHNELEENDNENDA